MSNILTQEINTEIKTYRADDPRIVFNYLSPENYEGPHRSWIFRGQKGVKSPIDSRRSRVSP